MFYGPEMLLWCLESNELPYLRKGDSMDVGLSSGTSPTLENSICIWHCLWDGNIFLYIQTIWEVSISGGIFN
jgi:hypothetical protein